MKQVAQLVKSNLGLEVAFTELSGWDTHAQQGNATGQLANRLDDFARSIAAFATDLGDRMADVVLVTMSEFGRTVKENGNRGTDHGHGNVIFVAGRPGQGRHRSTASGRGSRPNSAGRAATWRSRPTSERSSAKSLRPTWAPRASRASSPGSRTRARSGW